MTDDDLDVMFRQLDRIAKALDRIAPAADRDDDEFVYVMPAPGWWAVYDDAGRQSWAPLVGWGVTRSGAWCHWVSTVAAKSNRGTPSPISSESKAPTTRPRPN